MGLPLEQFQQNCAAVLRPELREDKEIGHFRHSKKTEMLFVRASTSASRNGHRTGEKPLIAPVKGFGSGEA
ncbi:hypothetical protein GFL39_17285 [Rhizobium leguminosarum bv. viciae]|nr:hypothetical protein [Rhizobium leguminosarum bv. viciae]NKL06655.1 hypothetical protein [Rhizobium leguminosarum bv. viciae]NKL87920.1 hypothetical protein [Rhizobium leguminosarum bv. viciae]NKL92932.1 hypothetical protein [Rhizobium leguminosarum bv. viciae]NKM92917.1 hypothetical protein [Rhizobium leguminosarum bv. viciae]